MDLERNPSIPNLTEIFNLKHGFLKDLKIKIG